MPSNPTDPTSTTSHRIFLLVVLVVLLVMTACRPNTEAPATDSSAGSSRSADHPEASPTPGPRGEAPPFFLGGIQVNEDDHRVWLDTLETRGMNTVSVTDYAHHGDWDTDHIWWDEENPGMLAEVRAAKAKGLHVVMILRVALDHAFERNQFLWHGMIMPETDEQLASWFEQYTRFVLRWAEIAEREGVDVLMIGSEMNALASTIPLEEPPALEEYFLNPDKQERRKAEMLRHQALVEDRHLWMPERDNYPDLETYLESRIAIEEGWARKVTDGGLATDDEANLDANLERLNHRRRLLEGHWIRLIEAVRGIYSGPLGYAANFDQYHEVGFWEHLDVMGINAYFKVRDHLLADGLDETERGNRLAAALLDGWRGVLADIEAFRASEHVEEMPLLFTEMGYTYRANCTLEPWADHGFALVPVGPPPPTPEDGTTPVDEREERLVVWRDQPTDPSERALAVRALRQAHAELAHPFLRGILYWKLSTLRSHHDIESFVLWIGEGSDDPLIDELAAFLPPVTTVPGSVNGGAE